MSRIGKEPVQIPAGVTVEMKDGAMVVKGSLGTLTQVVDPKITLTVEGNTATFTRANDEKETRAKHGLYRALLQNMVTGVSKGFEKPMYMKGVGYKASVKGNQLVLVAGYSHDVIMDIPAGLTVVMGDAPTEFTVKGMDKCLVGQFADKIHKVRKADPYKGKGIFYKGERIRRKEGKKK